MNKHCCVVIGCAVTRFLLATKDPRLIWVNALARKEWEMKSTRTAVFLLAVTIGSGFSSYAQAFAEADVVRQSKFCENSTRLPWGEVDQYAWDDCMALQGKLRSEKEYLRDTGRPNQSWMKDLQTSQLWASAEGCLAWVKTQPRNPPSHQIPGRSIFLLGDAWNACMQRAGIFTPPNPRK